MTSHISTARGKRRIGGCCNGWFADVAVDKHPQITLSNIRTSTKYSCLINDAKSPFISLNVTVVATKEILGQSYEKIRIWSDLGTSEENLTLNLRKTFDQCSVSSFGSANYPLHPQIFPATLLRKLPVTTSAFYPRPTNTATFISELYVHMSVIRTSTRVTFPWNFVF